MPFIIVLFSSNESLMQLFPLTFIHYPFIKLYISSQNNPHALAIKIKFYWAISLKIHSSFDINEGFIYGKLYIQFILTANFEFILYPRIVWTVLCYNVEHVKYIIVIYTHSTLCDLANVVLMLVSLYFLWYF